MYQLDEIEGDIRYEVKGDRLILKVKSEAFPNIPSGGSDCNIEIIPSTKLDSILATDENVYSALSTDYRIAEELNGFLVDINGMYLRKDIDDEASGIITFKQKIGSSIFIDDWNGKGWEVTSLGAATFDSLRVRTDFFIGGRMGSPSFASGFPDGWGWDLAPYKRINSAGVEETKYRLEIDDIVARNSLRVYEMIISQLRGEDDNVIFAGQMKVAYYDAVTGRLFLDTEGGVLYNPFRPGDLLMVQRYNGMPSADNDYYITKQYELQVKEVGIGSLLDGEERLDWITFKNFVGDLSLIAQKDVLTRIDSVTDSTRKGIVKITTIDELGTPHIDAVYGMKTNPGDSLLARMGNCSSVRTKSGKQLNETVGFYARGAYLEYSTIILDSGETIEQTFSAMNGKFESEISGIKNDMSLETGNIFRNSSFSRDTNYWTSAGTVHFINVSGQYLWVDDSFYVEKTAIADIYTDNGRNVLRMRNTSISQLNGVMNIPSRTDVSEDGYAYSFAFYVKVVRPGTLTAGFSGTALYIEQQLSASEDYQKISKTGKWNEQGNFLLKFTGEILIYGVSLFNDALADAQIKLQTQIDQTNEYIKLLATKDYVDSETGKIYIHYDSKFQVTAEQISGISTKVDNINHTIDTAGWITTADGNNLFASHKTVNTLTGRVSTAESSISNNAYSITQKVSATDYNGQTIISKVNQTASSYQIDAKNINLNGRVTFSMFDPSLQGTVNGKANSSSLGDLAYQSYVYEVDLATALASKLNGKVSADTLGSLAYASSISKNNFASSLLSEFNGKANSASFKALAYLDKVEKAELGATIVSGGHIITSLIDTDSIYANMASIGGFTIENGGLFSDYYTPSSGDANSKFFLYSRGNNAFMGFSASNKWVGIGLNTLPSTSFGYCLGRFENKTPNSYGINYGLYVDVQGGRYNYGLYSKSPCIAPVFSSVKQVRKIFSTNYTINFSEATTFVVSTSINNLHVVLPNTSEISSMFGYGTLPSDFVLRVSFIYAVGSGNAIYFDNITNNSGSLQNVGISQGGLIELLITNYNGLKYQLLNMRE